MKVSSNVVSYTGGQQTPPQPPTDSTPVLSGDVETGHFTLSNISGDPLQAKLFIQVRAG